MVAVCRFFPRFSESLVAADAVNVSGCFLLFGACFPTKGNLDSDLFRCTRLFDGELRGLAGFVLPTVLSAVTTLLFFFCTSSTVAAVAWCRSGVVDIVTDGYSGGPSPLPLQYSTTIRGERRQRHFMLLLSSCSRLNFTAQRLLCTSDNTSTAHNAGPRTETEQENPQHQQCSSPPNSTTRRRHLMLCIQFALVQISETRVNQRLV